MRGNKWQSVNENVSVKSMQEKTEQWLKENSGILVVFHMLTPSESGNSLKSRWD